MFSTLIFNVKGLLGRRSRFTFFTTDAHKNGFLVKSSIRQFWALLNFSSAKILFPNFGHFLGKLSGYRFLGKVVPIRTREREPLAGLGQGMLDLLSKVR